MSRVRISTTVDGQQLEVARRMLPVADSRLFDRALAALVEQLEAERELAALAAHPYEDDPDLAWRGEPGPDLPYEGDVPADVMRLAQRRRRRAG